MAENQGESTLCDGLPWLTINLSRRIYSESSSKFFSFRNAIGKCIQNAVWDFSNLFSVQAWKSKYQDSETFETSSVLHTSCSIHHFLDETVLF